MTELTREQLFDALQHGWGTYVERFQRLSSEAETFQNKKIVDRLHIELIGHLKEHEIP